MKKQRKQKPKARSRAGAAPQRSADARVLAQKKRSVSYAYAVHGKAPSSLENLLSHVPSGDRILSFARDGMRAFETGTSRLRTFAFGDVPQRVRPHVSRVRHAAVAASQSYSSDDRELAALLILPFLIIASAMVIGQSVKRWENFEVPVAVERPSFAEQQRLARARAIGAQPMVPLAASGDLQSVHVVGGAGDVLSSSLETFRAGSAKSVAGGDALGAAARVPDRALGEVRSERSLDELSGAEQQLAMLMDEPQSIRDMGPGRAVAPPSLTELPALEDDGSLDGAKHMCVAEQPAVSRVASTVPEPQVFGRMLAEAALAQTESFVIYNDDYRTISYPGGDVPQIFGVCTDVIVRAYRAVGIDLQRAVHEAKVGTGDLNIDHRRVEVLRRFFAKAGESLPITDIAEDYQPGDIVSYYRPQNQSTRSHIAIVSPVVAPSGRYMIIHNRGWGPQLEDGLFVDQITGHYRYTGRAVSPVLADPLAKGRRSTQVTPASLAEPVSQKSPRSKASAAGN